MANLFNSVKIKNRKRTPFNLSHSVRLTTEFGRLTPIMCEPVLPADKFKLSTTLQVQFAPMTYPVMERFTAYVHYFFVPNRLLWDNWEEFITGGETGTAEYAYPVIKAGENIGSYAGSLPDECFEHGSLFDYLGFPSVANLHVSAPNIGDRPKYFDALPFKAYQLIYNEWYRDQNVEEPTELHTELNGTQDMDDDDAFTTSLMTLRYRAWRKDYFTSALPDPQRGKDVTLPILGEIDINGTGSFNVIQDTIYKDNGSLQDPSESKIEVQTSGGSHKFISPVTDSAFANGDEVYMKSSVDTEDVAAGLSGKIVDSEGDPTLRSATINEVRRAFAVQRLYELCARVGGRYMENILGNFGVRAGDARLQRPEYLGGSVVPIMVGDVLQTSETNTNGTPLGMPAGIAGGAGTVKEFTHHFTEHGWIIGILSILPAATYMQGVPRKFLKRDRFDFAWPLLANLGEQEIESQELYFDFDATDEDNKKGFGYTPRYAEYKFGVNSIHGDFRSSLRDFHDARIFASRPALNQEFIECRNVAANSGGINRIFSYTGSGDHIWVNLYNNCKVLRKLPKYGIPI